jgi:hypothetical protein
LDLRELLGSNTPSRAAWPTSTGVRGADSEIGGLGLMQRGFSADQLRERPA